MKKTKQSKFLSNEETLYKPTVSFTYCRGENSTWAVLKYLHREHERMALFGLGSCRLRYERQVRFLRQMQTGRSEAKMLYES